MPSLWLIVLFITAGLQPLKAQTTSAKPNIIIILADDQGWGDLSSSGNPLLSTPHIDQIAQKGAVLENFYVSPVCSPTRAELLTGRYAARGGVYETSSGGERLDLDEVTFADYFKQQGYKTAAYGKWHNGQQYPYHPNARGFDDFYGFCAGHWGNYFSPMLERNGEIVKGEGFLPDDLTNQALAFIEANQDQPFLLYLPFNTPHSPMQVPDQWWNKFKKKALNIEHRYKDREIPEHTRAAYALCENIDWNVGRITEKLKALGLEENSIVIYLSDNGPNGWRWNGGMKGKKGSTDEGGVKVPFYIQWPGMISAGKRIKHIAGATDLFPTLAELAGFQLEPVNTLDGKSIKSLLLEQNPQWEHRFLVSYWNNKISVRDQEFRLDHQNRLFDIGQDPGQEMDVSAQHPLQLSKMVQYKNWWEKEVLSELPETDTRTFPVGHADFVFTHLAAGDGIPHGNIRRSNRWPNDSFFTNWISIEDSISWDIEVLTSGEYEITAYYTCSEENTGSVISLSFGESVLTKEINIAHDPPLLNTEKDKVEREESHVKEFMPLPLGTIKLEKGTGTFSLKALEVKGAQVMDLRLILLKRVSM